MNSLQIRQALLDAYRAINDASGHLDPHPPSKPNEALALEASAQWTMKWNRTVGDWIKTTDGLKNIEDGPKTIMIPEHILIAFFYLLMRDHMTIGGIYGLIRGIDNLYPMNPGFKCDQPATYDNIEFTNEYMEMLARDLIKRLV